MPVEILMPELGESVHEGTVSRWLKKVGDPVKEDEPIVEIMTDKVNTELPSPATGVLKEILIKEGDPVQVFAAMGIIDDGSAGGAPAPETKAAPEVGQLNLDADTSAAQTSVDTDERKWFTPVVRAMAKENNLSDADLAKIAGTGEGGRVTKKDLQAYLAGGPAKPTEVKPVSAPTPAAKAPEPKPVAPTTAGPDQELVPLGGMRKMIADHMIRASQVPVVTTIIECDVTNMVDFRTRNKDSFQETYGVKLTYTPFFIKALAESLAEYPLVNAQLTPDNQILMSKGVHIGIAVALGKKGDEGLIVPVIKDAQSKNLIQIAKDLEEIAGKARSSKLSVEDVKGGTFSLTNPGTYGASFGTPMINPPQSGILGVYAIKKQPVVINDAIAIRSIMNLVLTYDHRLIDGMLAGKFLASVRDRLQNFDFFR